MNKKWIVWGLVVVAAYVVYRKFGSSFRSAVTSLTK